jgi:hypothetical protein
MLSIVAHVVFWPALIWNVAFWIAAFLQTMKGSSLPFEIKMRNAKDGILSLVVLFIPGLYLFGLY